MLQNQPPLNPGVPPDTTRSAADDSSVMSPAELENYEALIRIAEILGDTKPRGLQKDEISQLPSYKCNPSGLESDQTCCVVCMGDFEDQQMVSIAIMRRYEFIQPQ